jgi:uncharacterized membrane protein
VITVTLYTRNGCHLCDVVQSELNELKNDIPHNLVVVDIDQDDDLKRAYGQQIPVVKVGPYELKAPIDHQDLEITLKAALDRKEQLEGLQNPEIDRLVERGRIWSKADGFTYWFARHYMAMFNLFVLLYLGLPVLAPVFMRAGIETPARFIYRSYSLVCHQLSYRSFFLFGEQVVYPRAAADVQGLTTFNQATGLSEASTSQDMLAARQFVGNEQVGYKIALCERDLAIYGAILLFGLMYAGTRRRLPPLPWYAWILIGLVPIGLDGVSQLLSQPPFSFWAFRESPPVLRTLTGALFGFTTAWFGYPLVEETMADTRRILATKHLRVRQIGD